jgi:hypothetical protein
MDIPEKIKTELQKVWKEKKEAHVAYAVEDIIKAELESILLEFQASFAQFEQKDQFSFKPAISLNEEHGVQVTLKIFEKEYTWHFTFVIQGDNMQISFVGKQSNTDFKALPMADKQLEEKLRAYVRDKLITELST